MKSIFLLLCLKFVHSRDCKLNSPGGFVGARIMVRLAPGETNRYRLITRSVISFDMREQILTTVVQEVSRAFEQPFEKALPASEAQLYSTLRK